MNDLMSGFHPLILKDKGDSFGMESKKLSATNRLRVQVQEKREEKEQNRLLDELNQEHAMVKKRHAIVLRQRLMRLCDLVTKEQYLEWLTGFVAFDDIDPDTDRNKRRITHIVEKDFNHDGTFLVAHHELEILALYHSQALKFLVPENVHIETTEIGMNQFFYMDRFRTNGKYVPYYQDLES